MRLSRSPPPPTVPSAGLGEDSLLFYASGVVPTSNTRNLQRQAWLSTDKDASLAIARAFFAKRFPDAELEGKTLQEMMGMEGLRVRNFYLEKAEQYKVGWKGRVFTPGKFELSDLTNQILTSTMRPSMASYAPVSTASLFAALSFIHSGSPLPFVYDLADLYKGELCVDLAFFPDALPRGPLQQVRRI